MKRIIQREGLPKVVQIVTAPSEDAVRRNFETTPLSLAGALGKRRLVRRALRVSKSKGPDRKAA